MGVIATQRSRRGRRWPTRRGFTDLSILTHEPHSLSAPRESYRYSVAGDTRMRWATSATVITGLVSRVLAPSAGCPSHPLGSLSPERALAPAAPLARLAQLFEVEASKVQSGWGAQSRCAAALLGRAHRLFREIEEPRQSTLCGETRRHVEHHLPALEPIFALVLRAARSRRRGR